MHASLCTVLLSICRFGMRFVAQCKTFSRAKIGSALCCPNPPTALTTPCPYSNEARLDLLRGGRDGLLRKHACAATYLRPFISFHAQPLFLRLVTTLHFMRCHFPAYAQPAQGPRKAPPEPRIHAAEPRVSASIRIQEYPRKRWLYPSPRGRLQSTGYSTSAHCCMRILHTAKKLYPTADTRIQLCPCVTRK